MKVIKNNLLRNAGLKVTKPRQLILNVLEKAKYPISIKDILKKISKNNIDQVTIYRNLNSLKEMGIVNQVDFRKDHALYELKDEQNDHHHIICTKCDMIEDFRGCDYEKIANKALIGSNFKKITGHSFEFFGICRNCINK